METILPRLGFVEQQQQELLKTVIAVTARLDALQASLIAALSAPVAVSELRGTLTNHIDECREARLEDVEDRKQFRKEVTDEFAAIRNTRFDSVNELRKFLISIIVMLLGGMAAMLWYVTTLHVYR